MDLSQLEVFLTVAREGRFSRAAEKLFRTQSAVSQTIRKLEDELGEPLFDRSSREGVLTDAGNVLKDYAEKLLNLRADAQEALVELRELQKGKLAMAANEFTVLYLLPVLGEFRRLHPMIKIMVQRALGSHIPDDIINHSVEMGVLSYDPQDDRLHSIVVYQDEFSFRGSTQPPACGRNGGEHPSTWRRGIRRTYRVVPLSRQGHSNIRTLQDSPAHGDRASHSAGDQKIRCYGKRSRTRAADQY